MKRPDRLTLLTWLAIAVAVAAVLAEGIALRDAGQRLRAQEAAEAEARKAAARDTAARAAAARDSAARTGGGAR
jgi:hypothetical protein